MYNKTIRPSSEKFLMLLYQNNTKKNIQNYISFRQILQHQKITKIPKQKPPSSLKFYSVSSEILVLKLRTTIKQLCTITQFSLSNSIPKSQCYVNLISPSKLTIQKTTKQIMERNAATSINPTNR